MPYKQIKDFIVYTTSEEILGLAIFDLDETLITSASGKNPKYQTNDSDDWVYLGDIINILKDIMEKNYTIVIATNQNSINQKAKDKIENVRSDLEKQLGISPILLISTNKNSNYHKPKIGMIEFLFDELKLDAKILKNSFMVGDASGEQSDFQPYKWKNTDKEFASNLGIDFYEPNYFFPSNKDDVLNNLIETKENIIIMMGNQGSGKSTFAINLKNEVPEYVLLRSDNFSNLTVMANRMKKELKNGVRKFIIDATNSSDKSRDVWISKAIEYGLSIHIIWSIRNGRPWNELRNKKEHIPEIGYRKYSSSFQFPNYTNIKVTMIY